MTNRNSLSIHAATIALFMVNSVHATPITYDYSGLVGTSTITGSATDRYGLNIGGIGVGSTVGASLRVFKILCQYE